MVQKSVSITSAESLVELRPKARTLDEVKNSRQRIAAAKREASARLEEMNAARHEIVISGSAEQIQKARDALLAQQQIIAELDDLDAAVQAQVEPIRRELVVEQCQKLAEAAETATRAWSHWFTQQYAELASQLAEGIKLNEIAVNAHAQLQVLRNDQRELLKGADIPKPISLQDIHPEMRGRAFFKDVKLPGTSGSPNSTGTDKPFWWFDEPPMADPSAYQLGAALREIAKLKSDNAALHTRLSELLSTSGGRSQAETGILGTGYPVNRR